MTIYLRSNLNTFLIFNQDCYDLSLPLLTLLSLNGYTIEPVRKTLQQSAPAFRYPLPKGYIHHTASGALSSRLFFDYPAHRSLVLSSSEKAVVK